MFAQTIKKSLAGALAVPPAPNSRLNAARPSNIADSHRTRIPAWSTLCPPTLVGSERVRRHPHRRARSGPQSGVSRGPRAYRVRVPILRKFQNPLFFRLVWPFRGRLRARLRRHDSTKLAEDVSVVLFEIAIDPFIREQAFDVAARDHKA